MASRLFRLLCFGAAFGFAWLVSGSIAYAGGVSDGVVGQVPSSVETANGLPATSVPSTTVGLGSGSGDCALSENAAECDVDADGWSDAAEIAVCGTARCADGSEDSDGDTVPGVVEFVVCGDLVCADAGADADADKVPDWVEVVVCSTPTCAGGAEDRDGDDVADWVEVLICDSPICADGTEDLDGNGIADHLELAKCLERRSPDVSTTTTVRAKPSGSGGAVGGVSGSGGSGPAVAGVQQSAGSGSGSGGGSSQRSFARTGAQIVGLTVVGAVLFGLGVVLRRRAARRVK